MSAYRPRGDGLWPSVVVFAGVVLFGLTMWIGGSYMEAKTYRWLTGADVTWWDAMWVDLRVMDAPRQERP